MSLTKKFNRGESYIEVEPQYRSNFASFIRLIDSDEEWEKAMEDIERQIKRHVDGLGSVRIVRIHEDVCEYCGSPWTEDSKYYNECCDKDESPITFLKFSFRCMGLRYE